MLTENILISMLQLQNNINSQIDPNWLETRNPFHTAIMVEGVELLDHIGWKWWKKQKPDTKQAQMEMVDIWHFALSHLLIQNNGNCNNTSAFVFEELSRKDEVNGASVFNCYIHKPPNDFLKDLTLLDKIYLMISNATAKLFYVVLFESIMIDLQMSWHDLYLQYIGKNVLNSFRQTTGYKDGTYIKQWGNVEDNVHLTEILENLKDVHTVDLPERINTELHCRYGFVAGGLASIKAMLLVHQNMLKTFTFRTLDLDTIEITIPYTAEQIGLLSLGDAWKIIQQQIHETIPGFSHYFDQFDIQSTHVKELVCLRYL